MIYVHLWFIVFLICYGNPVSQGAVDCNEQVNVSALEIDNATVTHSLPVLPPISHPWMRKVISSIQLFNASTKGLYLFSPASKRGAVWTSAVILMDQTQKVLAAHHFSGRTWAAKMINHTTIFVLTTKWDTLEMFKGGAQGHVWDIANNNVETVSVGSSSHDIDYDAVTDSWITAQAQVTKVTCGPDHYFLWCNRKSLVTIMWDDIIEVARNGTKIWSWSIIAFLRSYAQAHGSFVFSKDRMTVGPPNALWEDLSHVNGVFLDPARNTVYISCRNLDTAFALERYTGKVLWSVGRFGTEKSLEGQVPIITLFSRAHLFYPCGNDTYYTFDNNLMAIINGSYDYKTATKSRVLVLKKDQHGFREVFSYNGTRRIIGGGMAVLPEGHFITLFADAPYKLVEATSTGQVLLRGIIRKVFMYYVTRLYDRPLLRLRQVSSCATFIRVCVWDVFLRQRQGIGRLEVRAVDMQCASRCKGPEIFRYTIPLKAFWEESCSDITVPSGPFLVTLYNVHNLSSTLAVRRPCHCSSSLSNGTL